MHQIKIRPIDPADYSAIETITRQAFYNQYQPGASEHYLLRLLRQHADYLSDLDLVIEVDGQLAGNITYTQTRLIDQNGYEKPILTFGPLSIAPPYQGQGLAKRLMGVSFEKAWELGYDTIVIFGSPSHYVSSGFVSCKDVNVTVDGQKFPTAMLVKTLTEKTLDGRKWTYLGSPAYEFTPEDALAYDDKLPPLERKNSAKQVEFGILVRSFVE